MRFKVAALVSLLMVPQVAHAGAGLGLPDLGSVGNILIYGGILVGTVLAFVAPPLVAIYLLYCVIRRRSRQKADDASSSEHGYSTLWPTVFIAAAILLTAAYSSREFLVALWIFVPEIISDLLNA